MLKHIYSKLVTFISAIQCNIMHSMRFLTIRIDFHLESGISDEIGWNIWISIDARQMALQ